MTSESTLDTLWDLAADFNAKSEAFQQSALGPGVQRYLERVIARGTPLVSAVRLRMHGAMRWKLFGLIPVLTASVPDISRSAAGRMMAESAWLPSVLCGPDASWAERDQSYLSARVAKFGEATTLDVTTDDEGRVKKLSLLRWGNPDGKHFSYVPFGGFAEEEHRFSGYTIPSRLRIGYYVDSDRFDEDGEFIRIVIDDANYR